MSDLITTTRAKYNIAQSSFTSDEDSTISALVAACSKAIRRFCRREFDSQTFDELYNGGGQERLLLRQLPIISVARVAYGPVGVLRITNTSASNQRATVAVTATGLTLVRVASGTVSTDTTVTWAGNATLAGVRDAVNALGNGWSASVPDGSHNNRASADLRAVQGALNALNVWDELKLHVSELASYEVDARHGWLLRGPGEGVPCWSGGADYWRVIYTAGYSTVPEDVQEACAEWVAALYWQTKRDPGLVQESAAGVARTPERDMPRHVRALLLPYRDHKILTTGG
ncbi:MAG: hypothetical protein L0Z62_04015 [Gemmataceae bacterium]|nr:hypothetical protein [Gemmataceae bacterium]